MYSRGRFTILECDLNKNLVYSLKICESSKLLNCNYSVTYLYGPNLRPYTMGLDNFWRYIHIYFKFLYCNFSSYILRRPQNFAKSSPNFWLQYIQSKVRWRFLKFLWPSQNIWTLCVKVSGSQIKRIFVFSADFYSTNLLSILILKEN